MKKRYFSFSFFEHRIPELFFTNEQNPGEAVKALALASAQGQRIYQITSANAGVLDTLSIGEEVKDEIRAAVAVGREATVSGGTISVADWTGVGYIISDPETGAGAYRISGGQNGAICMWSTLGGLVGGFAFGFAIGLLPAVIALTGPFAAFVIVALMVLAYAAIQIFNRYSYNYSEDRNDAFDDCYSSGYDLAFPIGLLAGALSGLLSYISPPSGAVPTHNPGGVATQAILATIFSYFVSDSVSDNISTVSSCLAGETPN